MLNMVHEWFRPSAMSIIGGVNSYSSQQSVLHSSWLEQFVPCVSSFCNGKAFIRKEKKSMLSEQSKGCSETECKRKIVKSRQQDREKRETVNQSG